MQFHELQTGVTYTKRKLCIYCHKEWLGQLKIEHPNDRYHFVNGGPMQSVCDKCVKLHFFSRNKGVTSCKNS